LHSCSPDENFPGFIKSNSLGIDEFFPQVFQEGLVNTERPLQRTIGDAALLLQSPRYEGKNRLEIDRIKSTVWTTHMTSVLLALPMSKPCDRAAIFGEGLGR
jgi:hypothetical protein